MTAGSALRFRRWIVALAVVIAAAEAQAEGGEAAHSHRAPIHFSHPLIAESPSPDNKIRGDYVFRDEDDGERHTARFEGEYAFRPWLSMEVDLPVTIRRPDDGSNEANLDNIEVGLKYANFAFARHGVLVGGGLELGLPTGDDAKGIGSNNEIEIEPFLDAGFKRGRFEVVGFLAFGVPVNQDEAEEDAVDLELGYNLAAQYDLSARFTALLELDGETIAVGDEDETVVNITPGLKFRPTGDPDLQLGAGVSFPVTDDEAFDVRAIASLFYHF